MSIQVLTEAPGGYVEMSGVRDHHGGSLAKRPTMCCVRFRNGDFVIVSGKSARGLDGLE